MSRKYPIGSPRAHILTTIDGKTLHEVMLIVIGLAGLLKLQYDHEGHLDKHIHELFLDWLHFAEYQLSNDIQTDSVDVVPF